MPHKVQIQAESNEPLSLFVHPKRFTEDGVASAASAADLERLRLQQQHELLEKARRVAVYHDEVVQRVNQAQQQAKILAQQKKQVIQQRLSQIVDASGLHEAERDIALEQRLPLQVAVDDTELSLKLAFEVLLRRSLSESAASIPEFAAFSASLSHNHHNSSREPTLVSQEPFWDRGLPEQLKFTETERQTIVQAVKSAEIEAQRAKIQRRRLLNSVSDDTTADEAAELAQMQPATAAAAASHRAEQQQPPAQQQRRVQTAISSQRSLSHTQPFPLSFPTLDTVSCTDSC